MTADELIKALRPWRERWARPAWKPVTEDGDAEVTASKFAGRPWLFADERWPVCPECQRAMPLFVQLNLGRLPPVLAGTYGSGLLQLFYCTHCESGWAPFSTTSLVRVVQPNGSGRAVEVPPNAFPAKQIVDWVHFEDAPNPQEHEQLGLTYEYHFGASNGAPSFTTVTLSDPPLTGEVFDDGLLAEQIGSANADDKLAGWPAWVQDVEYPHCPQCQQQMRLVFQLGSEDHLPYMFGDVGIGHITQCPTHKDVVAFGWACS